MKKCEQKISNIKITKKGVSHYCMKLKPKFFNFFDTTHRPFDLDITDERIPLNCYEVKNFIITLSINWLTGGNTWA